MSQINSVVVIMFTVAVFLGRPGLAEPSANEYARAIVEIESDISPNGRTVETLGKTRRGSAVIIDASGLMVTVGYLVLEAEDIQITFNSGETASAEVIANDHASGLALLRAELPEGVRAISIGRSEDIGVDEDVVVLKHGGADTAHVARIAEIRDFAGSWEYYLDRAFYTGPATRNFSGAALLNRDAKLVGIGSLLLSDIYAGTDRQSSSGNLFIPVEYLSSQLGTLLTKGNTVPDSRPWIGVSLNEASADLQVTRVAPYSPAAVSGIQKGDTVIAINNKRVVTLRSFYQTLWDAGNAGIGIELMVAHQNEIRTMEIETTSRDNWLVD